MTQPQVLKDRTVVDPDPYPELGHNAQRYKHRDSKRRCFCDDCRTRALEHMTKYRRKVKAEVRAGRRPAPAWMKSEHRRAQLAQEIKSRERARREALDRHRAAVAVTRIIKAFDDQLDFDREYLPARQNRRAQLLVRIYVDEAGAGRWRERGAGS